MTPMRERGIEFGEGYERSRSGLLLPPEYIPEPKPIAVDLFAGAGGMSCGFHQAGWHVAAASEYDRDATATYLVNLGSPETVVHTFIDGAWDAKLAADVLRPGKGNRGTMPGSGWIAGQPDTEPCEHFYFGDIRELTGQQILDDLGLKAGDVGAVMGGPPCQGFSTAGKQNVMDPRNSLVFEFGRIVLQVMPKTFVMENVPAIQRMVTAEGVPVLDALSLYLSKGGYAEYEALKRSMSFDPNARAGIRKKAKTEPIEQDLEPDDQLELFASVAG